MGKRKLEVRENNSVKKIKLDHDVKTHPEGWTQTNHYGMCGQSCPCCRAKIEETPFGVCPICWDPDKMII